MCSAQMDSLPWSLWFRLWLCGHVVLLSWSGSSAITLGNNTDRLALLAFKGGITQDPQGILSTWNDSIHFCEWTGVICSPSNQRVVMLSLENQELVGSVSPSVGNLSFLTGINLMYNNFNGKIPEEMGRLSHLQHLNLSINSFEGNIPYQLSNLKNLIHFRVGGNNLTGTIPPWIGNYSLLTSVVLAQNRFHGSIPNELSQLPKLEIFTVYDNMLSGIIPPALYNISSIYYFSVTKNQLHGTIPHDVGLTLPNLKIFAGGVNNFHGPIPDSLSNASGLQIFDFDENHFTGPIPINLGSLQGLIRLNFGSNLLGSDRGNDLNIITALTNCTVLEVLGFDDNRLQGELPESIGNLSSHLNLLTIGDNIINGSVPTGIENLVNLTVLGLYNNSFSGTIPSGIGKLQKLQILALHTNKFTGLIPSSIGNLTQLNTLWLEENSLSGSLPPSLGNCKKLLVINVSCNNLSGTIPKEVLTLSSLSISFSAAHNFLSGPLPREVGNLVQLTEIEISGNNISGEIPETLGSCISLERLQLGSNLFQGAIPQSLKALRGIEVIDLSHNNLSGQIPGFLTNLTSLKYLDLSFNNLNGTVPVEGIFMKGNATIVRGNKKLCGGSKELHLPICAGQANHTSKTLLSNKAIISMTIGIITLVLLFAFCIVYWITHWRKIKRDGVTNATSYSENWLSRVSYSDIFNSTNEFASDSLIGEGSFGSVYKGVMGNERTVVAIKVLKLQQQGASKSFLAECDALRSIRHRNLTKILSVCASIDFKGNDFKALIFEFMCNGSLEQWLHPDTDGQQQVKTLSLVQRLNIAIDIAFALEYLHYCCEDTIVHCDLKPSNILLDADMTAHVGDFGLARLLNVVPNNQSISFCLKGSIGYIPPEYGMGGQVSVLGDVYSYGVMLLEMFTGRRPTDAVFEEGVSLYDFVLNALPDRILDIADPFLGSKEQENEDNLKECESSGMLDKKKGLSSKVEKRTEECLVSVIRVGLSCCAPSPKDRMHMRDVVIRMNTIRDSFVGSSGKSKRNYSFRIED